MFFSDHGGVQWLVVFLGNPGLKYQNTRHNAGFLTADVVEKDCGVHIDRLRFHALTAQAELGGQKVLLMKPQTFMNNSGEAVAPAAKFYKVPPEHILVVSDEIHLQPHEGLGRRAQRAQEHHCLPRHGRLSPHPHRRRRAPAPGL